MPHRILIMACLLLPAAAHPAAVRGRVVDSYGNPIVAARVCLLDSQGPCVKTGLEGAFNIAGTVSTRSGKTREGRTAAPGGIFDAAGRLRTEPAAGGIHVKRRDATRRGPLSKAAAPEEILEAVKDGFRPARYHVVDRTDLGALMVMVRVEDTVPFLDGSDFAGWSGDPAIWSIKGGAFTAAATSTRGSYLSSPGEYGRFRILFSERKILSDNHLGVAFWGDRSPPGDYGPGGSILVITPPGSLWDYGKNGGLGGKVSQEWSPDSNPKGFLWHRVEIVADPASGEVIAAVDGIQVTRYRDPNPGRFRRGPIRLQLHGRTGAQECRYKDIRIETDPVDFKLLTADRLSVPLAP